MVSVPAYYGLGKIRIAYVVRQRRPMSLANLKRGILLRSLNAVPLSFGPCCLQIGRYDHVLSQEGEYACLSRLDVVNDSEYA